MFISPLWTCLITDFRVPEQNSFCTQVRFDWVKWHICQELSAKDRVISGQKRLMSGQNRNMSVQIITSAMALCEIIFESKRIDVGHCDVFTFWKGNIYPPSAAFRKNDISIINLLVFLWQNFKFSSANVFNKYKGNFELTRQKSRCIPTHDPFKNEKYWHLSCFSIRMKVVAVFSTHRALFSPHTVAYISEMSVEQPKEKP